jgi:hypothetical protein
MSFIIVLTLSAIGSASPTFVEDDINVYLNNGKEKSVSVVIYDLDGIDLNAIYVVVNPHPDYITTPSHIRNLEVNKVDDYAVRVDFDVYLPNTQDIGFHRELMYLNNNQILNIAISNEISLIAKTKDFFNKEIKIFNKYYSLAYPIFWLIVAVIIAVLILMYQRFVKK